MASISSISTSGMQAAQMRLDAAAHNVANAQTEGFKRQQVVQQEQEDGGTQASVTREASARTALEDDMVQQLQAKNSFLANLAVFKTSDKMLGTLLDDKA